MHHFFSERLILRSWKKEDYAPFFDINNDSEVVRFLPGTLSREENDAFISRIESHFAKYGFGLFACEHKHDGVFIGFVGLSIPSFSCDFTPCVEIGWRLARKYWGQGLATEGAKRVLKYARDALNLERVVSFTVPDNVGSRRVMEKLGMRYIKDFDHPALDKDHRLCRHVLYEIELNGEDQ
ncbi:GNAT family N-acetyltransferase [Candidatus Uabimicrobium amorphum]|uniref:N-acetyltransferase n=1 Tax=Uabimicrobium amorphum TaxID=2596890 RepID=A0A5S9IJ60_UABAM|nr:GNAT family N-acetyltransferase [Candidatus Uabimicrobium amorphum]BBM82517.1 N-acetyltransferase [Candidatus Uabimicrobium amorphum]